MANGFSSPKKSCLALFCVLFPCFNVHNNLFWIHVRGICTSDSKGQLKYSLQSTYIVSTCGRVGRVDSFSIIFHAPWVKINKLDIAGKYLSFIQSKAN